jgi:hypothetical protein
MLVYDWDIKFSICVIMGQQAISQKYSQLALRLGICVEGLCPSMGCGLQGEGSPCLAS